MTLVNFTQDKTHYELLQEGDIELDISGAVPFNTQIVSFNLGVQPKIYLKNGQSFPVEGNLSFVSNKLNIWYFYMMPVNGVDTVIMNSSEMDIVPTESPEPLFYYRNEFDGAGVGDYAITQGSRVNASENNNSLLFEDLSNGSTGICKASSKDIMTFDTTGKEFEIEVEFNRDSNTDEPFVFMLRRVQNTQDKIIILSDTPAYTGARVMSALDNVYNVDEDSGISFNNRFKIHLLNNGVKFFQYVEGQFVEIEINGGVNQNTGAYQEGEYFWQCHRSGNAIIGAEARLNYIEIKEI